MPAKDFYHDIVKNALIKDGWTITNDPYILSIGKRDLFFDLGADKLLSAEKGLKKIAVEIKSFTSLYQFDKCLLQMVEVRKKEEGRRKKEEIFKKMEKRYK